VVVALVTKQKCWYWSASSMPMALSLANTDRLGMTIWSICHANSSSIHTPNNLHRAKTLVTVWCTGMLSALLFLPSLDACTDSLDARSIHMSRSSTYALNVLTSCGLSQTTQWKVACTGDASTGTEDAASHCTSLTFCCYCCMSLPKLILSTVTKTRVLKVLPLPMLRLLPIGCAVKATCTKAVTLCCCGL
jgi:hypothetical protein